MIEEEEKKRGESFSVKRSRMSLLFEKAQRMLNENIRRKAKNRKKKNFDMYCIELLFRTKTRLTLDIPINQYRLQMCQQSIQSERVLAYLLFLSQDETGGKIIARRRRKKQSDIRKNNNKKRNHLTLLRQHQLVCLFFQENDGIKFQ